MPGALCPAALASRALADVHGKVLPVYTVVENCQDKFRRRNYTDRGSGGRDANFDEDLLGVPDSSGGIRASCESLASLALPDTTITMAQVVAAGSFSAPGAREPYKDLPEFCRVAATIRPSSDSDIKVEIWLPASGWNRKLEAVGNGGWAGVISYSALADSVRAHYASVSTDTGHVGGSGSFALGHPEKLADCSWRSEHEMTVKAKAVIQAFYGSTPRLSYWNGCSTGGRQALKEAQRFPDDFDGIIAGAPANRTALAMWVAMAVLKDPDSYIPAEKYPMIHQAVLDACDARDGVKDGLLEDPTRCDFKAATLLCRGADGPNCLTAPQAAAAQKIYTAATNPRTGQELFPSFTPGTELGWGVFGKGPDPYGNILDQYKYVVFKDPTGTGGRSTSMATSRVRSSRKT